MFADDIQREIALIDDNSKCIELLKAKLQNSSPDVFDTIAAGGLLQNFYNGIENIMRQISKTVYKKSFSSANYHSELLDNMFASEENQNPVFSEDLKLSLKEYLGFRHVFRHSYGYKLDWERMKELFYNEDEIWKKARSQIEDFCKKHSN